MSEERKEHWIDKINRLLQENPDLTVIGIMFVLPMLFGTIIFIVAAFTGNLSK